MRLGRVAPRFPLTLRAMSGTRQTSVPARGRSILALSTLALLAFCCLPVLAQADSSGLQYEDAPPTVPGKTATGGKDGSANTSNEAGGGSGRGTGSSDGGSSAGGSSSNSGDDAAGGDRQGRQGNGSAEGKGSGDRAGDAGGTAQIDANPASSEDEGGTSPLVPILIAIAVLAAISIGVVAIRQRRRGDAPSGSSVSPEAG